MNRPYIICHMVTSLDGRVTGHWLSKPGCQAATEVYYEMNRSYRAQGFACGRVTMEESFTGGWYPDLSLYEPLSVKEDFVALRARFYAVALDRKGRLGWKDCEIVDDDPGYSGAHIIEVMTQKVDARYLAYLQSKNISYIVAGVEDLDLSLALQKLKEKFHIETLLLEGGSQINGAFLRAGAVDELSLVIAPVVGTKDGKPLFEDSPVTNFALTDVVQQNGVLIAKYKIDEE